MQPTENAVFFPGAILVLALLALCAFVIKPLFFGPLSKIPNAHWTSPISSAWILWTRFNHRELKTLQKMHQERGPVIRVGPKDLSVSCFEEGVKLIYTGGFEKPSYYDFFKYYGKTNAFCSLTKQDHSLCRRRVSSVYSKSSLIHSEHLNDIAINIIGRQVKDLLFERAQEVTPIDALRLSYALSLDIVNAFIFGHASGTDFLKDNAGLTEFLMQYELRFCDESFWEQELPRVTRLLKRNGVSMLPHSYYTSRDWLNTFVLGMCDKAERALTTLETLCPADIPVVYQKVKESADQDSSGSSPSDIRLHVGSELFDHMSSSREVLGLVLGYAVFYISRSPSTQARLFAELSSLDYEVRQQLNGSKRRKQRDLASVLDRLPYLDAVIKEALRMRPNSTPLPRVTPSDKSVSLGGYHSIPPNTRVNTYQWFLHRDPHKWERVDEWMPERWLHDDNRSIQSKGKHGVLWPFGSGSRGCVGNHLAGYIMRMVLALIYSNFTTRAIPDKQFGLHTPGSPHDRLMVSFKPVVSRN